MGENPSPKGFHLPPQCRGERFFAPTTYEGRLKPTQPFVNKIPSRLTPTQPFGERLPTL
ncbi:MAG: hypothetical protein LBU34_09025 [Planctomycetaceae bacterium]|nr:hypothetical protein [Planctomycetaceae bacterium]